MKKLSFIVMLFFVIDTFYGQGYYNKWYFGNGAGLDFSTCTPTPISGSLITDEGCSSISNTAGNLLFYTDGLTVWNANHMVMPNGTGLQGNGTSTQSALIVPNPGNANQYYIFCTPSSGGAFVYSIVDMTLAGGLGDVISPGNVVLHPISTERATAVRLPNGTDFWILGHEPENDVFFAYKLTAAGLSATPVLSAVGSIHSGSSNYIGYLKPSHSGNKLAIAIRYLDLFEIFDFNNSTGVISNAVPLPSYSHSYGVEFSPNDSKLYLSGGLSTCYIYQVNMNAGSNAAIVSSSTLIASPVSIAEGAMQLGPDGKIYITEWFQTYLSVINNPDATGTLCNYISGQVNLSGFGVANAGLPNYFEMSSNISTSGLNIGADTTLCQGQTLTLDATSANATYLWQDNSVNATFAVTQPGTYWIKVTNFCGVNSDTININYTAPATINLGNDTSICGVTSLTLNATTSNASYLWQDNSTNPALIVIQPGTYWVHVTTPCGIISDTIVINNNPVTPLDLGNDTSLCQGMTITLDATINNASYLWPDNTINPTFVVTNPGTYWVEVTTPCGIIRDTIIISNDSLPVMDLGNDTTVCQGTVLTLDATTPNTSYVWQDNSNIPTFNVTQQGTYRVKVTGTCGSTWDTIQVNYNPLPTVDLGNDTSICPGTALALDATTTNATYLWQDNSTGPLITISNAGIYWVKVTSNSCSRIDSVQIDFHYIPVVYLGNDTTLCEETVLKLAGTSTNYDNYVWQDNSTDRLFTIMKPGMYWVTAENECGTDADTIKIVFENCNCSIYVPDAFTPNNNGVNDLFSPVLNCALTEYQLVIYNRWGEQIFETNDSKTSWDGTFGGAASPLGVYVYMISYKFEKEDNKVKYGHITLIH